MGNFDMKTRQEENLTMVHNCLKFEKYRLDSPPIGFSSIWLLKNFIIGF